MRLAGIHDIADRIALLVIVLGAVAMSLTWVFLVPIFQSADEPQHFDYAICQSEISGLFRAHNLAGVRPVECVHPHTLFLMERNRTHDVAFHNGVRMPPKYGRKSYFRALDRDAPPRDSISIDRSPALMSVYPFGYYALVGRGIAVARGIGAGLTAQFFTARIFSVVMLAGSLCLTWAIARELRHSRILSLALTAMIGFLPLTSFVSSYVQPDNLSFLLTSWCFLAALIARRRPLDVAPVALLAIGLALLLVTKLHFFLCVSLASFAMLAVQWANAPISPRRLAALASLLVVPIAITAAIHLDTVAESDNYFQASAPGCPRPTELVQRAGRALADFQHGTTCISFWGYFGWLDAPLIIRDVATTTALFSILRIAGWAVFALTLLRLEQLASRLIRVARGGRPKSALRLVVANPVINSYYLFAILMFALHVALDNRFGAQGRNWFPLLLPLFLVMLTEAPKALTSLAARKILSATIAVSLAAFVIAGSASGPSSIRSRYYEPRPTIVANISQDSQQVGQ